MAIASSWAPAGQPLAEAELFTTSLTTAKVGPKLFRSRERVGRLPNEVPDWLKGGRQSVRSRLRRRDECRVALIADFFGVDRAGSAGFITARICWAPEEEVARRHHTPRESSTTMSSAETPRPGMPGRSERAGRAGDGGLARHRPGDRAAAGGLRGQGGGRGA